jgi:hypothetical protein
MDQIIIVQMDGSDNKNKSNFAKQTASATGSKKIAFSRTDKVTKLIDQNLLMKKLLFVIMKYTK